MHPWDPAAAGLVAMARDCRLQEPGEGSRGPGTGQRSLAFSRCVLPALLKSLPGAGSFPAWWEGQPLSTAVWVLRTLLSRLHGGHSESQVGTVTSQLWAVTAA